MNICNCQKAAKHAAMKQVEEEILFQERPLSPGFRSPGESPSEENAAKVRDLQNQVKALQKENSRLRNLVINGENHF